jgi:CheY-like chemotaxis protein
VLEAILTADEPPRDPRDHGTSERVDVLLVEDDPGDVLITREAFEQYGSRNQLHVVSDGEQAIQFLHRAGDFSAAPRPGLILLDLNLPRRNGLEVLAEVKSDSELLLIPVVVLTTSGAQEDILRSYSLHANAYVTKPIDFDHFIDTIRQIDDFYLALAALPRPWNALQAALDHGGWAGLVQLPVGQEIPEVPSRATPRSRCT